MTIMVMVTVVLTPMIRMTMKMKIIMVMNMMEWNIFRDVVYGEDSYKQ